MKGLKSTKLQDINERQKGIRALKQIKEEKGVNSKKSKK